MSRRRQIVLDLELDSEPIAGTVRAGDGADTPFEGWLQLAAAIERASADVGDDGEP